jgi:hypothetical protein
MTPAQRDRIAGAVNRFTDARIALANARYAKAHGNDYRGYIVRARLMHADGMRDMYGHLPYGATTTEAR